MTVEIVARDLAVVELHEEVAGDADCEEVDARATDDLVGAEMDRKVRVEERQQATGRHTDQQPHDPRPGLVRAVEAPEGAHQHQPLERDVHDAAPLGEDAGDRAEDERRRKPECLGNERRIEDGLEVPGPRPCREDAEADPEQAPGDRAVAKPPTPARSRPDPERGREDTESDRPGRRTCLDRRDRKEGRKRTEADRDVAGRGGVAQPLADGVLEAPAPGGHAAAFAGACVDRRGRSRLREFQT